MNKEKALNLLADTEVVPIMTAGVADAKEFLDACLNADIPVVLAKPDACCGSGHSSRGGHACSPKLEVCARPEDIPRIQQLFRDRWNASLEREGTLEGFQANPGDSDELPCPACGTAAPLKEGACVECGLVLE